MNDESHSDHRLASSLPAPTGPYRSLSAKRFRDPSHRKSVSFNDVPIVHEVPSFDTMRNSNCDTFRSWTFTDATPAIPVASPFSTPQILSPFHSTSAAAQKIHANRLSSALYSSTNSTTVNRSTTTDWSARTKPTKPSDDSTEQSSSIWSPPVIVVHTPDERANKSATVENAGDEKKPSYRSPIVPDTEHYRSLPFTYTPVTESTNTYTSMISTNVIPPTEPSLPINVRPGRARSATLPITVIHSSARHPINSNENVSITPFRTPATASLSNGLSLARTVLKPTTIAFQCSQLTSNASPTLTPSSTFAPKPLSRPTSSVVHSRSVSSSNRPLSSSMKYTSPYATADSISKPSFSTVSRSRSANVVNPRRYHSMSPVASHDGQSGGNSHSNFFATAKRNPNVRQTYGSYYMHRVLLPANIN